MILFLMPYANFAQVKDANGNEYKIVKIGNQTWMAENLNYATGNSWCYDDNPSNCYIYGRLYDWKTALNACPSGWHLPSEKEWEEMIDLLGGKDIAGGKLKKTSGWPPPNKDATNSSGFSGLPGGGRGYKGQYMRINRYGYWWSATESSSSSDARNYYMNTNVGRIIKNSSQKNFGLCVRCLKN